MDKEYILRDRFYDQAMFALCNKEVDAWPFQNMQDVTKAINVQLHAAPPSADIFSKIIAAEVPSHSRHDTQSPPAHFIGQLMDSVSYPLAPDKDLGMMARETSDFFFDLFSHYKEILPNKQVGVVEVDISNMGGANDAIGRDNVTAAVAVMNRLYMIALENPGRFIRQGDDRPDFFNKIDFSDMEINTDRAETTNVVPVRKGGDELRYYISGISEDEIGDRVKLANRAIAAFTAELGTEKLQHTKYKGKADEAEHAGFGAGAGIVMLQPRESRVGLHELQETIDNAIDDDKAAQGKAKGLTVEELETAATIKARLSKQPDIAEKLDNYKTQLADGEPLEEPKLPRALFRADGKNTDDIYLLNTARAKEAFTGEYGTIFQNVVEQFINKRDPITKMRTHTASIAQLGLLKEVEPDSHTARPMVVEVELSNLQGLNKQLNHEHADELIRQFADIVRESVTDELGLRRGEGDVQFYSAGGGKIRILVKDHNFGDVKKTLATIDKRVANEINSQVITIEEKDKSVTRNEAIATIPHPKDSELAEDKQRKGVGIGYVALETHPEWSVSEHLAITDLLMEKPVRHQEGLIHVLENNTRTGVADDAQWMKGSTHDGLDLSTSRRLPDLIEQQAVSQSAPKSKLSGGSASREGMPQQAFILPT